MAATITCRLVSLNRWADELRAEQARLVGRARRCRNSLAHGGPFSACTLATVSTFAASHAGLATVTALQGALGGVEVADSLERKRADLATWATRLANASEVADAIAAP